MSTETATEFRIHRFRDSVAISIGEGGTQYLDRSMAKRLAMFVKMYADDIDEYKFTESTLNVVKVKDYPISS